MTIIHVRFFFCNRKFGVPIIHKCVLSLINYGTEDLSCILLNKPTEDDRQCNPDIRQIFLSGPKLEPVILKQNRPNPDIRDLFSGVPTTLLYPSYTVLNRVL